MRRALYIMYKEEIDMINIKSAVLHILDFNSGLAVYSQEPLNLTESDCLPYIERHLEKSFFDERLKTGIFHEGSEFRPLIEDYISNRRDLISISEQAAKVIYDAMAISDKPASSDIIVCDFEESDRRFLAILILSNKSAYTHQILQAQTGFKNELIQHLAVLPSASQKLDEFAFIDLESMKLKFVDKKRNIDGHNAFIFRDYVLKCSSDISQKEAIKLVTKIADKIAEDNGQSGAVAVSKVKSFIVENSEVSENLKPAELIQEVFAESEYMQTEFEEKIKEAGIPKQVKVDRAVAVKTAKSQKIKA